MKKFLLKNIVAGILPLLLAGCGLSIYHDWQASGGKAITGGGAVAGKDYINGLLPSADSRKYFSKLAANSDQPIETVSRADDNPSKSGVRFVKNGGILIPPGVTISFTNKGYCMDPHLPAPVANEEYQLVPVTRLIPDDLQGTYKKLVQKASAGDESVLRNMQHLVWALRTAGTDAAYANNLTSEQKRILNRCSEYSGQFEEFNANAKANSQMMKELLAVADSYLNVKIGGVSYKASDLLDPDIGNKKINEHLNQLITMSKSLPVERSGFNYGELQKGIYTDVRGAGVLAYNAKIANTSDKEFIFYPTDYAGQVGSGTKSQGLSFFATANTSQRQRVTGGDPDKVEVDDQREPENKEEEKCPPHKFVQNNNDILEQLQKKHDITSQDVRSKIEEAYSQISDLLLTTQTEYGGLVYVDSNNQLHYTRVTTSGKSTSWQPEVARKFLPPDAEVVGMWHTHGRQEPSFWSGENLGDHSLSAQDIAAANDYGWHVSMLDFDGNVHHYDPLSQKYHTKKIRNGAYKRNWWDKQGTPSYEDINEFREKQHSDGKNSRYCLKCGKVVD